MRADRIPPKPVVIMMDAILAIARCLRPHTQPTARPRWRDTTAQLLILGVAHRWGRPTSAVIYHRVQAQEAYRRKPATRLGHTMHLVRDQWIWVEPMWVLSRVTLCTEGGTNRDQLDLVLANTTRIALLERRPLKMSGGLFLTAKPGRRWSLYLGTGIVEIVWPLRIRTELRMVTCPSKSEWSVRGNANGNV